VGVRRGAARLTLAIAAAAALSLGGLTAPAAADVGSLKASCQQRDAADGDAGNGVTIPIVFCDDGVPPVGGRTPNVGAIAGIAVPQRYDGFLGLPPKVAPDPNAGADANGDIAIDADVTMPDPSRFPPPPGGYPLVAMMHGCCAGDKTGWEASSVDAGGERWHYSNAWFAARGYVVLNYTSRGFVNGEGRGSTGESWLDHRSYEINDFQHMAGQLADDPFFHVDPQRVVATGGSYGGGFSWLALTDPTWRSPGGRDMRLAAAAPKYGWSDLPYSLIPSGTHFDGVPPSSDVEQALKTFGMPKTSIVSGLFLSGRTGIPSTGQPAPNHATFPPVIDQAFVCLGSGDPFDANPACPALLGDVVPSFYANRSAYYQNHFFERVAGEAAARVPVFSAGTFTDQLFTTIEHRRMVDRLKSAFPGYPVQQYHGDYQHFVQNKAKEWGDLCGADRHVCRLADFPAGDLDALAPSRVAIGVTSRLNAFVDHYVRPQGNPDEPQPAFDVTASLQICPQNADDAHPADEPGDRFTAATFDALAPNTLTFSAGGLQATANASAGTHSGNADPIFNSVSNGGRCAVETSPAGAGTAVYESNELPSDFTMVGIGRIAAEHTGSGPALQLDARMYDVMPNGTAVLVDRGVRRVGAANETTTFPLHGNGWRFPGGHRIRVELTQDDAPFVRHSNQPSSLLLSSVRIELPVREASAVVGGEATGAPPPTAELTAPRLASDAGRDPRFALRVRGTGDVDHYEVEARNLRREKWSRLTSTMRGSTQRFAAYFGSAYRFRARAVGRFGQRGPWDYATTIVPLDDSRSRNPSYGRGWRHVRARSAWGLGLTRASRRGRVARFAFRGAGRIYLIGRRTPSAGSALVTLDGRRKVVRFRSAKAADRALVATLKARGRGRHVLRLVTRGGGPVDLDAFGIATR
jgi:hypothetical protein